MRDGPGETAPLFGKYCGTTLPAPILSSANVLWIRFKSDSSVSLAGFRAVYEISKTYLYTTETVKAIMASFNACHQSPLLRKYAFWWLLSQKLRVVLVVWLELDVLMNLTKCLYALWVQYKYYILICKGRHLSLSGCGGTLSGSGQIRTPLHPDPYPHNKMCEWVINQPTGYVVTLNFLTFDVEGNAACLFDYVEVHTFFPI